MRCCLRRPVGHRVAPCRDEEASEHHIGRLPRLLLLTPSHPRRRRRRVQVPRHDTHAQRQRQQGGRGEGQGQTAAPAAAGQKVSQPFSANGFFSLNIFCVSVAYYSASKEMIFRALVFIRLWQFRLWHRHLVTVGIKIQKSCRATCCLYCSSEELKTRQFEEWE